MPAKNVLLSCDLIRGGSSIGVERAVEQVLHDAEQRARAGWGGVVLWMRRNHGVNFGLTARRDEVYEREIATRGPDGLPETVTPIAPYCVIYKGTASDQWYHNAGIVALSCDQQGGLDPDTCKFPAEVVVTIVPHAARMV